VTTGQRISVNLGYAACLGLVAVVTLAQQCY
jgi:hypothetical protein